MKHTIDATNKRVGRVATEAATILMGKTAPSFARNAVSEAQVHIVNASKANVDAKKLEQKTHSRYSGYPSGLKKEMLKRTIEKKGYSEIFRMAIKGMLPKNKLQAKMMKNLTVTE